MRQGLSLPLTYIITQPDGSQVFLTRSTNGSTVGKWRLLQSEIKNGSGVSFGKTVYTYANDGGGSPQVQSVNAYDDAGQPTLVWFEYDQYGNVIVKREYGHQVGGQFLARRRTRLFYKTDTAYINAYLRSLVVEVAVYDALLNSNDLDDVMMAKTTMTYDDYAAMGGMEVYAGQPAPPGHDSTYDATKTVRGNVTGTTQWIDLATNNSITRLRKIDKFGNTVKEQVSCCNERSYVCDETNCWSSPEQVTSGNTSGLYLTTTSEDDFNTGAVERQEDPNGRAVNFSYDEAMRPVEATTDPASATVTANFNDGSLSASQSVTYNDGGTQKTVTSSTEYDGWGRVIESISSSGAQVNTVYDAMGRVASRSNPFPSTGSPQYWTAFQYDTLGRQTVTTLPDGNTLQTSYSGLTVTTTDQVNRKMKREADSLGRLVKVTEQNATGALSQETVYTYDLLDRLTGVNQGNQTRAYKYDGLGRLLYERIPEQGATIWDGVSAMWSCKYTWTDFNAVATRMDARGAVTNYTYDTLNRLTQVSYSVPSGVASTPTVVYQYDNNQASATTGLLMSVLIGGGATNAGGSEENYSYDSLGRISTLQRRINVSPSVIRSYTSSYQYNSAGQVKQITYPSGRLIQPSYDNVGRMSALSGTANYVPSVSYDTIGRVSGMSLGNGVVESYGYDAQRMQMTSQTAVKGATTLMSLTYNFQASAGQMGAGSTAGNAGQLMSVSGSIGGQAESAAYTYDLLGRLVTSNQTTNSVSAQRRFEYDRWGNRTAVYDATSGGTQIQSIALEQSGGAPTNRITSVTQGSTVNYTYDAAGNVTSDGAHSYTYDAENRLVSVDSGSTAQYGYDHSNRRIKKTVGGVTTHCVWEGAQVIAENNASSGSVNVEYVYSGSRMVASIASGVTRYYLADRLSARVTMDTAGNIVGRQAHLPFGEELNASGTTDKHRFTSYERDTESGLDYAVNRSYSAATGRFLQVDPVAGSIKKPQRINRYAYARNEPINFVDVTGRESITVCVVTCKWVDDKKVCRKLCVTYDDVGDDDPDEEEDDEDGEEESGGGQGPISKATQAKQKLAHALRNLGPGCTTFFGGKDTLDQRADEVLNDTGKDEIKFVAQGGPGWHDPIPDAPRNILGQRPTYREFWRGDPNHEIIGATVVAFPGQPPQDFDTIILGNFFFNGPPTNNAIWRNLPQQNRLDAWQNLILVHEYMHILNNAGDQELLDKWIREGGQFPSDGNPSFRLSIFLAQDCPHSKK
jgi:RHS repeat-associated protein